MIHVNVSRVLYLEEIVEEDLSDYYYEIVFDNDTTLQCTAEEGDFIIRELENLKSGSSITHCKEWYKAAEKNSSVPNEGAEKLKKLLVE